MLVAHGGGASLRHLSDFFPPGPVFPRVIISWCPIRQVSANHQEFVTFDRDTNGSIQNVLWCRRSALFCPIAICIGAWSRLYRLAERSRT